MLYIYRVMKIVTLPGKIEGLVFDIDLTLYESREYYNSQLDLLIEELARESGEPLERAHREIDEFKKEYADKNGGRKPALGQVFLHFGVTIEKNCEWRTRLFKPEEYLSYDARLAETISSLSTRFRICAVTNNTTAIARRTLDVLGVNGFFPVVVGLDRSKTVKPSIVPFRIASSDMGLPFDALVSIGDRMEVDIELPVEHGMGGILVESMDDVYSLPALLVPLQPKDAER
jgi:FMN phosphatase YigB (HAD superfamily)